MSTNRVAIIGIGLLTAFAAVYAFAEPSTSKEKKPPILLAELHERGVEGRLGVSFGTIVEVSGVVVENRSRMKADSGEPFFLRVDEVNARKLKTPQLYASTAMPLIREDPALKVGEEFHCIGYERGSFRGSPDGEFDSIESYATQGFHFAVDFVVLQARTPKG